MAKILIVDDNLIMRRNLRIMLEKLGHEIVGEIEDGRQIVRKYKECVRPDIVTLDITMPIVDGITALENLKDKCPEVKVVMISAVGQKSKVLRAMHLGAEHYIIKPIREELLENVIEKVLKKSLRKTHIEFKNEDEKNKVIINEEKEKENLNKEENVLEVINENGEFIIKIKEIISEDLLEMMNKTVNGFLVIKPLTIRFKVKKEFIPEEYKDEFEKLMKKISIVGGECVLEYV